MEHQIIISTLYLIYAMYQKYCHYYDCLFDKAIMQSKKATNKDAKRYLLRLADSYLNKAMQCTEMIDSVFGKITSYLKKYKINIREFTFYGN
jgi:hypothetical protein